MKKEEQLTPEQIEEQKNPYIHKMYPHNVLVGIRTKDDTGGLLTEEQRFDLEYKTQEIRNALFFWHTAKAPYDKKLFRIADEFIANQNHPTVRHLYNLSIKEFSQLRLDMKWWGWNVFYGNLYPDFCEFIKTRVKPTNELLQAQIVWKRVINPNKEITDKQLNQLQALREGEITAHQLMLAAEAKAKLQEALMKPKYK